MKSLSPKTELEVFHRIVNIMSSPVDLSSLLRQISKMIVDVLGGDSCLIYLYDEHKQALVLSGAQSPHPGTMGKVMLKLGEGITGWVGQHKQPVCIAEKAYQDARFKYFSSMPEDKYESFLSVPILLKNQLVGVINLQNRRVRQFKSSEIELLSTISKQVSGYIDNVRLYTETLHRAKQIEALTQVSRLVAGKSYLDEILRLIVSITAESLGFKICSLMLLDEKKQELAIVATQSLSEDYRNKPHLKVSESLSGRAILEKRPIVIEDVCGDKKYRYPDIAKREGLASLLSVPMMVRERCIGVLNSYTPKPHRFTETEIKILASVANQAAIAIENTRLMQESEQFREELESRKLVERAKGLLMQAKKISEDQAFKQMRRAAMDRRKTIKEIAQAILLSSELS
jgi:signal transduction protein with GAF and PtsI domain